MILFFPELRQALESVGSIVPPLVETTTEARTIEELIAAMTELSAQSTGALMVMGAEQSGGHIKIYSEPGEGSTIKLYLPRSDETGQKIMTSESEKTPLGGSERILVVEDDELVRGYVQSQLTRFGYRVHAVTNALGAFTVPGVPPGRYELHVWHESYTPERASDFPRIVTVSDASRTLEPIRLAEAAKPLPLTPHKNKYGKDYGPPSDDKIIYPGVRN